MPEFTVQDLFVAGLALDLIGASLLAKSLFKTPRSIAERATEYAHFDPPVAVQLTEDKVDANFGLGYLASGFIVQAIGYEIVLASESAGNERGFGVAATALAIALFLAIPALGAWRYFRPRRIRSQLVKIAAETGVDPT
ncbi:MAG: hypothetical protein WAP37_03390, partial [Solirubrobacterales bacterium]